MKILLTNLPDQICHISHTLNIQTKWIYSAIYSVTRFQVELEILEGMDHIISSQLLLQRLLKYNSAASTLTTCYIYQSGTFGHQSSGTYAPELWCSPFFWGLFPLLRASLCWQCSDKIRKYRGHIETVRKKENQNPDAGS